MKKPNQKSAKAPHIATIFVIILFLLMPVACKKSTTDTTAGASWSSWVMEQIADGIIHYSTDKSIGWILSAFGGGGSFSDVSSALRDMNGKLTQIEADLAQIENELGIIEKEIKIDTDTILSQQRQDQMTAAQLSIDNQFKNVQLFAQYGVPGSDAAKKAAQDFANDFLSTGNNDMDANIYTIYGIITNQDHQAIGGALNALTTVLVDMANDGMLMERYQTLESYFNSLLEVQMKGAVLMVEALHHRDDPFAGGAAPLTGVEIWPGTAQQWYEQKFLPQIADEVEEFLRCTDRLVLADADLRTDIGLPVIPNSNSSLPPVNQEPFLPADADAIFSRADFLAAQMSPTRHSFGLVVRGVGEPDSINAYVAQNKPPTAYYTTGNNMHLTPLGPGTDSSQWVNVRLVPVEVWNNWPNGYTRAYMQWNWRQGGDGNWDYLSFNSATQIAVTKYEIGWYGWGINADLNWLTASPESAKANVTIARYNDKMVEDPSGTHAWGHATLVVRHRPTAWRRYTFNPDSYDSRYFTITNDYTSSQVPWVRLISTFTGYDHANASFSLESSLTLHIVNGESQQRKATAIVQMQGDTNGSLFGSGAETMTAWFTGASGETVSWNLRNANGYVYPGAGMFHYWNPGEDTAFHFKLNFNNTVSTNYHNAGEYVGARIWPLHIYLFF